MKEELDNHLRIRNPESPFSAEPTEELRYSKEHGTLTVDKIETPRTCFYYVKNTNRTFMRNEKKDDAEKKRKMMLKRKETITLLLN